MREESQRPVYRVLSTRTIVLSAIGLVAIGVGVVVLLLFAFGGGSETDRARLEVIKTAGAVVVGTGGAAALLLAARRQRTTEIALRQKDIDQSHQERVAAVNQDHQDRVAAATEMDAAERRVTDLCTKAVEQLGSEKAPVRLGGMYALERLAQNVPNQRQTIVNVLCAYLRMPYTVVAPQSSPEHDSAQLASTEEPAQAGAQRPVSQATVEERQETERHEQERQVRLTAQRILRAHLYPGDNSDQLIETFWPNIDLDLTGATLLDFELCSCRVGSAYFERVQFYGYSSFEGAVFDGAAEFASAQFVGSADFYSEVSFKGAHFNSYASFASLDLKGHALFEEALFGGNARFECATFGGGASFKRVKFNAEVSFDAAWFNGARFDGVKFGNRAEFYDVDFKGNVTFTGAKFYADANFATSRFNGDASFREVEFKAGIDFDSVRVRVDLLESATRAWPQGYFVIAPVVPEEGVLLGAVEQWGYVELCRYD